MSELAQELVTKNKEELLYQLWEQMPQNMRLYQELQAKSNSLHQSLNSRRSKIDSRS